MGDEVKQLVMSHMRKDIMTNMLDKGKRLDGRKFDEYRKTEVHKGVINTAEGSGLAKIGETMVLVAAKFDVATPFPDRPNEGVFIMNSELLPTASPTFETGPPRENSIELARTVDRAIRSSEAIDVNTFFIEEGKVLGLFMDIYVLNHGGNFTDAATLAASAALLDAKMPKIENAAIVRGEYTGPLNPKAVPISTTFVKVGNEWIIDPLVDEENVADTRITIATTENNVCTIQKGEGSVMKEELLNNIDIAFKKGSELRGLLRK
jgi:exosome complex component RRP42